MRTSDEIATARAAVAFRINKVKAMGNPDVTKAQSATLFGLKTGLELIHYVLPVDQVGLTSLFYSICDQAFAGAKRFRSPVVKPRLEPVNNLDVAALRARVIHFGNSLIDASQEAKDCLLGMRQALAWVLELPAGGRGMQELYEAHAVEAVITKKGELRRD